MRYFEFLRRNRGQQQCQWEWQCSNHWSQGSSGTVVAWIEQDHVWGNCKSWWQINAKAMASVEPEITASSKIPRCPTKGKSHSKVKDHEGNSDDNSILCMSSLIMLDSEWVVLTHWFFGVCLVVGIWLVLLDLLCGFDYINCILTRCQAIWYVMKITMMLMQRRKYVFPMHYLEFCFTKGEAHCWSWFVALNGKLSLSMMTLCALEQGEFALEHLWM